MAKFIRRNAWNNGGTFNNPDLLWYAKGVGEMQSRSLDDENSWWFFAAIHGEVISLSYYPGWGKIPGPPAVPTTPLPSQNVQAKYWNQCQHQSWYFPPWHRGYLIALEKQVRAAIIRLGGPSDWALPYWNYFGPGNEYEMPPAFAATTLPDGSPNPLFVNARYGPLGNRNIFIQEPPANQDAQNNTVYTGSDANTPLPGYGGPDTGFHHGGGSSGNLESNPHNLVHTQVGGTNPNNRREGGVMAYPSTAGLDPIFYFHHCNIDRMWASWNAKGNSNPTNKKWLQGPAANGEREFVMPLPDGTSWVYTPADVTNMNNMDYVYESLATAETPLAFNRFSKRLRKLGAGPVAANIQKGGNVNTKSETELFGAHDGSLSLKSSGSRATVRLDKGVHKKLNKSLKGASEQNAPDHVYLMLENVRGNLDGHMLDVTVNRAHVGKVSLFGLLNASLKDGQHGGAGLTLTLDITDVVDDLFVNETLDASELDVRITPHVEIPDEEEITIGRVSVYRHSPS